MELQIKRPAHIVPSYSLTGDLLSYLRCGLQYRYYNGSALPPSRPVQLWFGEFIHGVLESSFRYWKDQKPAPAFPWPCTPKEYGKDAPKWEGHDIGRLADRVEHVLACQGKWARSKAARESAYRRAETAVNQLGPHLFPLISAAEAKVIGTREIPLGPAGSLELRTKRYELHGVIDVLTDVELAQVAGDNLLKKALLAGCKGLPGNFEVIVDYKGASRPLTSEDYWKQGQWQVQTYAWLRESQAATKKVAAGVLIYINELAPGSAEFKILQGALKDGSSDVLPAPGSQDAYQINTWKPGRSTDTLSLEFRLRRAIRVIPVTSSSIAEATKEFDATVRNIETDIASEATNGEILKTWKSDCKDGNTCVACDFRHFCPSPADAPAGYKIEAPPAP
jgi:hypothetical protein